MEEVVVMGQASWGRQTQIARSFVFEGERSREVKGRHKLPQSRLLYKVMAAVAAVA